MEHFRESDIPVRNYWIFGIPELLINPEKFPKESPNFFFLFSNTEISGFPNIFGINSPEMGDFYWFLDKKSKAIAEKGPIFFQEPKTQI